jgi:hypothetical protein
MNEHSIWAYPWDLHDIGPAEALARIKQSGASMVSLATSYHAGRFLLPGNPRRRVFFPQDGTVYYKPDPSLWQGHEIVPLMADLVRDEGCMLSAVNERRATGGPGLSCWTVCLHNTRLGMLHPDHVVRTAHGDPHYFGLCPSSPAARDYVITMIGEIAQRFSPDRIEVESPDFMGFSHGYHHEKDGLPVQPEDDFLLGVCFCRHCMARATDAGIDAVAAQAAVCAHLDASFARELPERQFPDFPAKGIAAFDRIGPLAAYLRWRHEPVTSLVAGIKSVVPPSTRLMLIDFEGSWWGGVDLAAMVPHLDGVLHCAYVTATDRIAPVLRATRDLIGPDRTLIAGFQLFHPNVRDRADLVARVAETRGLVQGCNFYNLGLVPPARLDWIRSAVAGP